MVPVEDVTLVPLKICQRSHPGSGEELPCQPISSAEVLTTNPVEIDLTLIAFKDHIRISPWFLFKKKNITIIQTKDLTLDPLHNLIRISPWFLLKLLSRLKISLVGLVEAHL